MVVSMKRIQGPSLGGYDAAHLRAVPQKRAESVAPNVLRDLKAFVDLEDEELDPEELLRLLTRDEVHLSEEAKDLLRKLKKRKKRGRDRERDQSEEQFLALLDQLEAAEVSPPTTLPHQREVQPFLPPVMTLSTFRPVDAPPPKRSQEPEPSRELSGSSLTRTARIGADMVAIAPNRESVIKVAKDLEVFGQGMLTEVKNFGTRIVVVDAHTPFTDVQIGGLKLFGAGERTFDGRPWSAVRGVYASKRRVICLGEELLDESRRSGRSTVRHEFAHAYEDAWSKKRQRHHPLSVELWYRFEKSRRGFITEYASTQPAEYFAESVEAYFISRHRETLRRSDPEMHQFLVDLFGQA